ncbi:MAG: carboxypeptidase-like regulatory domain-containing protein [Deltaproteobacteria bacterium]|nr:carboxypeptidase-like regulatory domain-containing protein [Deltaproteobacteria bacterium]
MMKPNIPLLKKKVPQSAYAFSLIFLLLTNVAVLSNCGSSSDSNNGYNATIPATYSIWGTVSGAIGKGATITLSGTGISTATTTRVYPESVHQQGIPAVGGFYGIAGLDNGSYTITPSLAGYTFTPVSVTVTIDGADISEVNFTSTTISPTTHD